MSHAANSSPAAPARVPRVVVFGGLTRLAQAYAAQSLPVELVVANEDSRLSARHAGAFDAFVVVPSFISHQALRRVRQEARRGGRVVRYSNGASASAIHRAVGDALRALTANDTEAPASSVRPLHAR